MQEANEESKAVTKASAMKGVLQCYVLVEVISVLNLVVGFSGIGANDVLIECVRQL